MVTSNFIPHNFASSASFGMPYGNLPNGSMSRSTSQMFASEATSSVSTTTPENDKASAAITLSNLSGSKRRTESPISIANEKISSPEQLMNASSISTSPSHHMGVTVSASPQVSTTQAQAITPHSNKRVKTSHSHVYPHHMQEQRQQHHQYNLQENQRMMQQYYIHHKMNMTHHQSNPFAMHSNSPENLSAQQQFANMQKRMQYLRNTMHIPSSNYISSPPASFANGYGQSPSNDFSQVGPDNVVSRQVPNLRVHHDVNQHSSAQNLGANNLSRDSNSQHQAYSEASCPPNQTLLPDGTYRRKDKSLSVLCVNFMQRYESMAAENPSMLPEISIDEASRHLAVERRRIYDIINILEAIDVVSRKCKNTYNWHGLKNAEETFYELQKDAIKTFEEDAIETGFKTKMEEKVVEEADEEDHDDSTASMPTGLALLLAGAEKVASEMSQNQEKKSPIKEKSLGKLSQKFIQLFLIGKDVVELHEASDKIMGENNATHSSGASAADITKAKNKANKMMKTKIRRLYDIANVMTSIGLITKSSNIHTVRNRPSFKWAFRMSPDMIMQKGKKRESKNSSFN